MFWGMEVFIFIFVYLHSRRSLIQMGHCAPRYVEFINYSLHPVVLVYYFTDTGSGTVYSMVC